MRNYKWETAKRKIWGVWFATGQTGQLQLGKNILQIVL